MQLHRSTGPPRNRHLRGWLRTVFLEPSPLKTAFFASLGVYVVGACCWLYVDHLMRRYVAAGFGLDPRGGWMLAAAACRIGAQLVCGSVVEPSVWPETRHIGLPHRISYLVFSGGFYLGVDYLFVFYICVCDAHLWLGPSIVQVVVGLVWFGNYGYKAVKDWGLSHEDRVRVVRMKLAAFTPEERKMINALLTANVSHKASYWIKRYSRASTVLEKGQMHGLLTCDSGGYWYVSGLWLAAMAAVLREPECPLETSEQK
jgi:hypothetical protein